MADKILILRHGEPDGRGYLSAYGYEQINTLKKVLEKYQADFSNGEMRYKKKLVFSFSSEMRAVQTAIELKRYNEEVVVTNYGFVNRESIPAKSTALVVNEVLDRMNYWGVDLAFIVAHGIMPAVVAETIAEKATGEEMELDYPGCGCGYMVDLDSGEVLQVSEKGVFPIVSDASEEMWGYDEGLGVLTQDMPSIPEQTWNYDLEDFPEEAWNYGHEEWAELTGDGLNSSFCLINKVSEYEDGYHILFES